MSRNLGEHFLLIFFSRITLLVANNNIMKFEKHHKICHPDKSCFSPMLMRLSNKSKFIKRTGVKLLIIHEYATYTCQFENEKVVMQNVYLA